MREAASTPRPNVALAPTGFPAPDYLFSSKPPQASRARWTHTPAQHPIAPSKSHRYVLFPREVFGSRLLEGGLDGCFRRFRADIMLGVFEPVIHAAVAEFPVALAELRDRLPLGDGPLGLVGGSMGAWVAQSVLIDRELISRSLRHDNNNRYHGGASVWLGVGCTGSVDTVGASR